MIKQILAWIRERIDCVILSDFEWKKKYCPHLYAYLTMDDAGRKEVWERINKTRGGSTTPLSNLNGKKAQTKSEKELKEITSVKE